MAAKRHLVIQFLLHLPLAKERSQPQRHSVNPALGTHPSGPFSRITWLMACESLSRSAACLVSSFRPRRVNE